MKKRFLMSSAAAVVVAAAAVPLMLGASTAHAQVPQQVPDLPAGSKVFKYAFLIAETGFDPAQLSDLYSNILVHNMMEGLYEYEPLDQSKIRPLTAAAMPEISSDFRTWTIRIKPGIFFNDDPAFGGKKRELTAQDYVYSYKRLYDPKNKSPNLYLLEGAKILGLSEIRKKAMADKVPFPYDEEAEGLRALDRYTLQFKFADPQPRAMFPLLAASSPFVAVAREVVEKYGDAIMAHPVGTGPFKLVAWRRSSKMVFDRNPNYRNPEYDYAPPAIDGPNAERIKAVAAAFKGKKMPMVDRVEVSIIEESQPRYLAFVNGETHMVVLPGEFINIAVPNNKLAPNLSKAGIVWDKIPNPDVALSYFNMNDPVVGGYTPEKVALRRAIALANDEDERRRQIYKNQAVKGQGLIPHNTFGYDATMRTAMSEYSVAKAKALLDTYGYVDKNGDGWREQPNGKPLVLEYASQPDGTSRQLAELWKKYMDSIGIKIEFKIAKWPENLKASTAGKLMMWGVGWSGGSPDSDTFLALGYSPNAGQANKSRFNLPAYDALYQAQRALPDGPERAAAMQQASKLAIAYMPFKVHVHRTPSDLIHPWVVGWFKHPFQRDTWKFIDIDESKRK